MFINEIVDPLVRCRTITGSADITAAMSRPSHQRQELERRQIFFVTTELLPLKKMRLHDISIVSVNCGPV